MSTSEETKTKAVALTRRLFDVLYGKDNRVAACMHWVDAFMEVATFMGLDAVPQAGTARWRVNDGSVHPQEHTVFSYQFTPNIENTLVRDGKLVEVHGWCVILDGDPLGLEVVDFTTGFAKENSSRVGVGIRWQYELPPYIWASVRELKAQCEASGTLWEYTAHKSACLGMCRVLQSIQQHDRLCILRPRFLLETRAQHWLDEAGVTM